MKHSKTGAILKRVGQVLSGRRFAVIALALAVCASLFAVTCAAEILYVVDGGETSVTLARRGEPEESVLSALGITLGEHDSVAKEQIGGLFSRLSVNRGLTATIVVDGLSSTYSFRSGTVGDLLAAHDIILTADDYCSAAESRILSDGDVITVNHVVKRIVSETVSVDYEVTYKASSLISTGAKRVVQSGEAGSAINTYEELWDGEECVSRTLISSRQTKAPVEEIILQGQAGVAVSRLDWSEDYPLDENGVPRNYAEHYSDRLATGYSAGEGSYGAGGGYCYYGTVAVHPSIYPYGTKLYIRSADGRFVYGYAIANDTGVLYNTNGSRIDFDLFYETYRESALNGLKTVEVYVLEWGNGTMYG